MTEQLEFQTLINSDPELNYTVSRDALLRLNIINVIIFNLLGGKWMPFVVSVLLMWRLKIFFLNCMFVIKSYNTIIWSWVISMQKDAKNVKEKKCFETKLKKKMVLLKIYNWVEIKHCKVKHDPLPISKNNVLLIKEWHILFIPFLSSLRVFVPDINVEMLKL